MPIYTLTLSARKTIANNTLELRFIKPDGFQYLAGQYGGFTLMNPEFTDAAGTNRRFSLASAPHENELIIVTRVQHSAYKKNLSTMPLGSTLKFAGPTGNFTLHPDTSLPAIFLAGGIGIAPFYSMIKDALHHQPERHITLFYGNQSLADTAYYDELQAMSKQHPHFKLIPVLANETQPWEGETGYITENLIQKFAPQHNGAVFYACGSPAMVSAMQTLLSEMQINDSQIRVEDFPGY